MTKTNRRKNVWIIVAVCVLNSVFLIGMGFGLSRLYVATNWLWIYFLELLYNNGVGIVLWLFIMIWVATGLDEDGRINRTAENRAMQRKLFKCFFVIAFLILCTVNFLPVANRYKVVLLDGKQPSQHAYTFAVLQDALSGETETALFSMENVFAGSTHYTIQGGRGGSTTQYTNYIAYHNDSVDFSTHQPGSAPVKYIRKLEALTETITIEYYVHSGIIKRINNCDINDVSGLSRSENEFVKREEERQKKELEEEIAREEREKEQNRLEGIRREILLNGAGVPIEMLKAEIKKRILFLIAKLYISAQSITIPVIWPFTII